PAFAAAMLEHQVLRTIPVGRHVLLIADILVAAGSDLAGRPVEDVHQTGQVRVIALQRAGVDTVDWSPGHRRLLAPRDRIYVLATRAGLARVLARVQPPAARPRYRPGRAGYRGRISWGLPQSWCRGLRSVQVFRLVLMSHL